jgi:hypothetical protein
MADFYIHFSCLLDVGSPDGKQRGKVTRLWGEQRRKGTHPV